MGSQNDRKFFIRPFSILFLSFYLFNFTELLHHIVLNEGIATSRPCLPLLRVLPADQAGDGPRPLEQPLSKVNREIGKSLRRG